LPMEETNHADAGAGSLHQAPSMMYRREIVAGLLVGVEQFNCASGAGLKQAHGNGAAMFITQSRWRANLSFGPTNDVPQQCGHSLCNSRDVTQTHHTSFKHNITPTYDLPTDAHAPTV
jgi:hypothetical protein